MPRTGCGPPGARQAPPPPPAPWRTISLGVCSYDSFLFASEMYQAPAMCPVLWGTWRWITRQGALILSRGPPEADPKEGLACGAPCGSADSTRGRVGGMTQKGEVGQHRGYHQACYHRRRLDPTPHRGTVRSAVKFTPRGRAPVEVPQ